MKRTTSRPPVRQPRGLSPLPPASPFRSHLPLPPAACQRREESVALGKRVAAIVTLVLAAGCVVSYFAYRSNLAVGRSLDAARRTGQQFVAALTKHDFQAASAKLSPSAQRLHTPLAIQQEVKLLESSDGTILASHVAGGQPRSVAGLQTYRADYVLNCEQGPVPLHLVLVRGYRIWTVESYSFG